jgi:hypothetical protein
MTELCETQIGSTKTVKEFNAFPELVQLPKLNPLYRQHTTSEIPAAPICVCLNLENLKAFEVVHNQFHEFGVVFGNAIALHPSNPAYPVRSGDILLLGAPQSGWLEATFERPANFVRGFVTSSRQTVMAVYDAEGNLLAQTETAGANLAGSDSPIEPNAELALQVPNIHRVVFRAFDGEITLDDFAFSLG